MIQQKGTFVGSASTAMSARSFTTIGIESQSRSLCIPLLTLILLFSGCASRSTRKTSSIKRVKNVNVSATELSYRNQSLLAVYSSQIEVAADQIIEASTSALTRRQALLWKSEAIPVLQRSLLNTDPVAAVIDTWAFIFQMNAYMEQPAVRNGLSPFEQVPHEAVREMEFEMEELVRTAAPSADIEDIQRRVRIWANEHPIQTGLSGRKSPDSDLIRGTYQDDLGALSSLTALQEGLGDITARLDSYNAYLPKQARWQAELLANDFNRDPAIGMAASNLTILAKAAQQGASNLDRIPQMAARARRLAIADVDQQRLAVQAFLTGERERIADEMTQQRIDAVADLRGERLAATADLRAERQIVLDAVHTEEVGAMSDLREFSQQTLNDFDRRSRHLADHFFWRILELVLFTLCLSFIGAWILLQRFSSRTAVNGKLRRPAA
jgi:hypothetical protein